MVSPLVAIRQKEVEVAALLAEARAAADDSLRAARQAAAALVQQADAEGRRLAEQTHQAGLDEAHAQAETIRRDGQRAATRITHEGQAHLDEAAEIIVRALLPVGARAAPVEPVR